MAIEIVVDDRAPAVDVAIVERGLLEQAAEAGVEPRQHRGLVAFARDEGGGIIGGLVGETVWGWLQVKQLWVAADLRRRGYGTALLQTAEEEARRRGCHAVWLDTFDFQAPRFYQRLGYAVFGSLPEFPRGHVRYFMQKTLDPRGAR